MLFWMRLFTDWFQGTITGKPHISRENQWFPVHFPSLVTGKGVGAPGMAPGSLPGGWHQGLEDRKNLWVYMVNLWMIYVSGWWWLEHLLFSYILEIVIPIDSYFSQGWLNHQPLYSICDLWVNFITTTRGDRALGIMVHKGNHPQPWP